MNLIWLTNIETAEQVGICPEKIVLIEQKRPQDGGAVTIYLDFGKEVQVSESIGRIREMIETAAPAPASNIAHLTGAA